MTGQQPRPGSQQGTGGRRYPPQPQQWEPIPSRQPIEPRKKKNKNQSWWPIIAAAIIGAIATIFAGLIANGTGALHISVSSEATPTVTVTPPPAPTVTVTASSSGSGAASPASCLSGQNCKVSNLTVSMESGGVSTAINLEQGQVKLNDTGDLNFKAASDGTPELTGYYATYSLDVTTQNASRQQCQTATNTAPDPNPITNFHTGLLVCASIGNGIALIRQTKPLGNSNTLYLQETYWPNSS